MAKAILSMGLPGAGKSTVLRQSYDMSKFINIDPDEIKKEKEDYDPKRPEVYHEWSKIEARRRMIEAMSQGADLIIDGTGTNVEKMFAWIRELQSWGYEVELLYVKVKLSTAMARNARRERNVPESIIREKFETISVAFEILSGAADHITVKNND